MVCHTAGKVGIRIVPIEEPFFTNNFLLDPDSNIEQKPQQTHLWKQVVFGCLTKFTRVIRQESLFLSNFVEVKGIIADHGVLYQAQNNGNYQM